MHTLVTGAAGFIGSHLAESLLLAGHTVIGLDSLTAYYDPKIKLAHLEELKDHRSFRFLRLDLAADEIRPSLDGVEAIFHLAGQPGVRASWGTDFSVYAEWNVLATQRLLDEALRCHTLKAFVNASSSSIYGNQSTAVLTESLRPNPISPYGVTKLAAEHLTCLYGSQFGLPTASLRFFTVYGPRQRPDMGISRLIRAALDQEVFQIHGDGMQQRDFTFVHDIVSANLSVAEGICASRIQPGSVFNVGSSDPIAINELVSVVSELSASTIHIIRVPASPGDPRMTYADTDLLRHETGWKVTTNLKSGIEAQLQSMI